jgi:hypothetical protein
MVLTIDGEKKMELPLLIAQAKRRPPPNRMEN